MRLSVSDTESRLGERYRSSEFVLMSTFCFLLIEFRGLITIVKSIICGQKY